MWAKRKRINEINKGKTCKEPGCNFTARAKGYCSHCQVKNQRNRMTYKKAGVDIEKEERAIQMLLKEINKHNETPRGHYAGLIRLDD